MPKADVRTVDEEWWCVDWHNKAYFPEMYKVTVVATSAHYLWVEVGASVKYTVRRKRRSKSYFYSRYKDDVLEWMRDFYWKQCKKYDDQYRDEMENVRKRNRKAEQKRWKAKAGTKSQKRAHTKVQFSKSQ